MGLLKTEALMRFLIRPRPQRATVILITVALSLMFALAIVSHVKARNDAGAVFLEWNTVPPVM